MKIIFTKISNFILSNKLLLIIIISIISFNTFLYLYTNKKPFPDIQTRKDASGFTSHLAQHFIYFYYYTGNFPLATLDTSLIYSKIGAYNEISENGKDLIMEYKHWSRLGEHARILAYLPNAILNKSPKNPSIKLFNTIVFVLSLITLLIGFWKIKKIYLGLILVLLINFTPFYIFETFSRQNIFAILGSTFFIIVGLNIFVLFDKKVNFLKLIVIGIISSIIIGFFSEIRNEIIIVFASFLLFYILSDKIKLSNKILLPIIFVFTLLITKQIIRTYFDYKYEKTKKIVEQYNGHVYNGPKISGHTFWHPIFCGLGDFDTKYGYAWNDKIAYKYAVPILKEKYGIDLKITSEYYPDNYYDKDSLYYIKYEEINEYNKIIKEKVIYDIKNDFIWYIKIIIKRILRVLTQTLPINYIGWFLIPILIALFILKKWEYIKLLIISLPLSFTPIFIYSGKHSTYNSVFSYFIMLGFFVIIFHFITKIKHKQIENTKI